MMKKALVLALAAVACAAWFASSELPELGEGDTNAATVGVAGFPSDRAGVSAARPRTFATLPDRGNLVSYPTPSPARVDGAYTWHRAELSEEHAFRSLQTGSLRITSPSGKPLEFEYSRHIEHPSGDWTWIGRLKGGQEADEAVITFGERAAFGAIAEPGKPDLRLTTSAGVAWLIETDPRKIATIDSEATRPTRPDYLLPPEQGASSAASQPTPIAAASAPTPSAAVAAAAATTVDVVVGYTTGFASALGGQSQAVTRLNNMVEIANEAYRNSQVDAEIRMVHALQVNYPDNTSNADTLEKLTGYRSGSGQIPVDPAFTALRAARDQYGGDLVTLVRRFQTPENDGCGIAWLIGGGQTGIDAGDAPFGYSVVADSNGRLNPDTGTDGKSYFCRDETLAHELGHNMGSQHDRATSTENGVLNYGVFPYSFGYRADAAGGNFYTVMAYGDSGQSSLRVFSNPRISFCGSPCGVADQSDNARSLSQTMPVVAAFRASVVVGQRGRARGDINGDGRSDIFWRSASLQLGDWWYMNGAAATYGGRKAVDQRYRVAARGDFNGDGRGDILWEDGLSIWMWLASSSDFVIERVGDFPANGWSISGAGDFNGDGRDDILWSNRQAQLADWWLMSGSSRLAVGRKAVASQYRVAGIGDLDGDARDDVLWEDNTGLWLWRKDAEASFTIEYVASYPVGWTVVGVGDINGDGREDLLWSNRGASLADWWYMNGAAPTFGGRKAVASQYAVVGLGDFNGDNRADVLWGDASTYWVWRNDAAGGYLVEYLSPTFAGWVPYL